VSKPKVNFVIQRCGKEVNGGGESLCYVIAERMARHWDIEVLTTCALDYTTWENHYAPGLDVQKDFTIRRFLVDSPRIGAEFDELSRELTQDIDNEQLQLDWMNAQGPVSTSLCEYLKTEVDNTELFIFFTYLYGTTWYGLPIVSERAILSPLAHDEWTIHLNMWDDFFEMPKGFIFNTPEERTFVQHRFPTANIDGPVIGLAIDDPSDVDPTRFRQDYGIDEEFILYVGRVDESKGCLDLIRNFRAMRNLGIGPERLVFIGKSAIDIPNDEDILFLGFVETHVKWDALAACSFLVMPSKYESLSIAILEAWKVSKPVLVNGECDVLVGQCKRSNGGLWYSSAEEFINCMKQFISGSTASVLGRQGKAYVDRNYTWEAIESHYLSLVDPNTKTS